MQVRRGRPPERSRSSGGERACPERSRRGSRADRNRPALTPEMAARLARYFGTSRSSRSLTIDVINEDR
jgi:hypothetical protein